MKGESKHVGPTRSPAPIGPIRGLLVTHFKPLDYVTRSWEGHGGPNPIVSSNQSIPTTENVVGSQPLVGNETSSC